MTRAEMASATTPSSHHAPSSVLAPRPVKDSNLADGWPCDIRQPVLDSWHAYGYR